MTLKLKYNLSFEDLYSIDGLRKIDGYFMEELLKKSPELCNKMLDARRSKEQLYKLEESKLILALAPYLEDFIAGLFHLAEAVKEYKDAHKKLDIVYKCNKFFIQRHVMQLPHDINKVINNIKVSQTFLMMHGILLPCETVTVDEAELDMAESFLAVYANSKSDDVDWADYHKEILSHIENYSLWAILSHEGQKLHKTGALFRVPKKLDHCNIIPNLELCHSAKDLIVTRTGHMMAWIMLASKYRIPGIIGEAFNSLATKRQSVMPKIIYAFSNMNRHEKFFYIQKELPKDFHFRSNLEKSICKPLSYNFNYLQISASHRRNRKGFQLNDDGNTALQVLHEANYCLYCHNRGKDSCSHGLPKTEALYRKPAAGCPLKQKISEMHLLKASHNIIAALATVMIDNPMVAATGHRICNDCMNSCIFQKQTPVDTPAVESSILKDVLFLPFGFEIYSLLSRWNPLNFSSPLAQEPNNYHVMVVGMGPAGFTLAHYLLNSGVNVIGIDGLKIELLPQAFSGRGEDGRPVEFKPIKSVKNLFKRLEHKPAHGFGGVMEYGITVRWDKNMLDIIRLLLLRRRNFKLYDGVRFDSNITYDFCKQKGIDHIALAIGAGSPNIPAIKNILAKGVRMASDFLMSLHLTAAYRSNVFVPLQIQMPIVVIGGGLTAVDAATEAAQYYLVQIRKFLHQYKSLGKKFLDSLSEEDRVIAQEFISHAKQLRKNPHEQHKLLEKWGRVTILYRRQLQESPAYQVNHEELSKAFEEGIKFVESANPLEILTDKFGHCSGLLFEKDGKRTVIPAKAVIVATGTNANTSLNIKKLSRVGHSKVSYFGDADPKYNGSVVKAMASAKDGYKQIINNLWKTPKKRIDMSVLHQSLVSYVEKIERLTPSVVEVVVKSPLSAANFRPGQFFRLQNYESNTKTVNGQKFCMEGIALTGANIQNGSVSLIVLELGVSSKLCQYLKPGERVVLMGPTGTATTIPQNENVLLIGGGLGNAVLTSIGQAMRQNGCNVLYLAGYKKLEDRFKPEAIESAADTVIWCCDEGLLEASRHSDISFHGNMIDAIEKYQAEGIIDFSKIQRMIVIGSDKLMHAVAKLRNRKQFKCPGVASVNAPMNCMMKGICAQCIQRHKIGKKQLFIYSCAIQDQNIDTVDFNHLEKRLKQNSLLERTADALFTSTFKS